jgi:hypothetical protein
MDRSCNFLHDHPQLLPFFAKRETQPNVKIQILIRENLDINPQKMRKAETASKQVCYNASRHFLEGLTF